MAFSTTWIIDKYKSKYESEEHWQLRKKFMETHKSKFPEERLVCLAQVFFNVEFLGCRYPEKTMQLIADLSRGVADEHREKQIGKLKRTFVQASDAANAKITRAPAIGEPQNKINKTNEGKPQEEFKYTSFVHAASDKNQSLGLSVKEVHAASDKNQSLGLSVKEEFPGFILFENCNNAGQIETSPIGILQQSSQKNIKTYNIKFDLSDKQDMSNQWHCDLTMNYKVVSSGTGKSAKEAKLDAAKKGLNILRKTHYTIQAKCLFFSQTPSINKDKALGNQTDSPLPKENIGLKMMQKMGWTGSGLGKDQQGIQEPIKASAQIIRRTGFGGINKNNFQQKFRQIFKEFIANNSNEDLIFSSDFTSEERKALHKLAQNLQLKTRSYGKDDDRHLVVFKSLPLPILLQSLLASGGESDKYLLIPPGSTRDTCSSSVLATSIPNKKEDLTQSCTTNELRSPIVQSESEQKCDNPPNHSLSSVQSTITSDELPRKSIDRIVTGGKTFIPNILPTEPVEKASEDTIKLSDSSENEQVEDGIMKNIDRLIQSKKLKLEEAIENYNKFVVKYGNLWWFDGKFTKKDRRRYSFWRNQIKSMCGVQKQNIINVPHNCFKVGDFIIDKNVAIIQLKQTTIESQKTLKLNENQVINSGTVFGTSNSHTNNSRIHDASFLRYPQKRKKSVAMKKSRMKKRIRTKLVWDWEQRGAQLLEELPDIKKQMFKDLSEAHMLAEAKGDTQNAKLLRKKIKLALQALGGRTNLPKYFY